MNALKTALFTSFLLTQPQVQALLLVLMNYRTVIKSICGDTPLFIGFGIDSCEKVKLVQSIADGAIIGSAYLKALSENKHHKFLNKLSNL